MTSYLGPTLEESLCRFWIEMDKGTTTSVTLCMQAKPTLAAFQRPREAICPIGYGLIYFARIEVLFGPQFVKNDELFLKIEFSST